jgi:hypothetical protein
MPKMGIQHGRPQMFSLPRFSFDLLEEVASDFLATHIERHKLVRQEAVGLIEQSGPAAFETAQQIALLARQRNDVKSTKLWLDVAAEIARRDAKNRR